MGLSCSLDTVLLALFPFVLVLTKSSSVVGVASLLVSFNFVGSFCLIFYVSFALFLSFVVCCTACRITSRGGFTTVTRWRRGIFLPPVGVFFSFFFFSLLFFWFFFGLFVCLFALALSPVYFLFFCAFLSFVTSLFNFHFYFYFFVFRFLCVSFFLFFSLSVYRGSWRMYVVPAIAQHNGMPLYYCLLYTSPSPRD